MKTWVQTATALCIIMYIYAQSHTHIHTNALVHPHMYRLLFISNWYLTSLCCMQSEHSLYLSVSFCASPSTVSTPPGLRYWPARTALGPPRSSDWTAPAYKRRKSAYFVQTCSNFHGEMCSRCGRRQVNVWAGGCDMGRSKLRRCQSPQRTAGGPSS